MAVPADPEAIDRPDAGERLEAEVHHLRHRLRNAFAVSAAIAVASAREMPEHQAFAAELAQRFSILSRVQARLLDQPESATLPCLAAELTQAFVDDLASVRWTGLPDVRLEEQQARLVALVLGELFSRSLREGALAGGARVSLTGGLAGARLSLEWRERIGGEAGEVAAQPGMRLIARMARAHGGSFACASSGGELVARLELPVTG